MRAPLYILAALSLAGGFLPLPHFLEAPSHTMPGEAGKIGGMVLGGAIAVAGIAAGLWLFLRSPAWAVALTLRVLTLPDNPVMTAALTKLSLTGGVGSASERRAIPIRPTPLTDVKLPPIITLPSGCKLRLKTVPLV